MYTKGDSIARCSAHQTHILAVLVSSPALTNNWICFHLCQVNYRMHSWRFCLLHMLVSKWAMKPQRDWGGNNEKTIVLHTIFFRWLHASLSLFTHVEQNHQLCRLQVQILGHSCCICQTHPNLGVPVVQSHKFWRYRGWLLISFPHWFYQGHLSQETGLLSTQFRFRKWQVWIRNQWLPLVNNQLVASCQLRFLILLYYIGIICF